MSSSTATRDGASFRDNRGFIFWKEGQVYRQVNTSAKAAYERLMSGGLYQELVAAGLLVEHTEVQQDALPAGAVAVLKPALVPMIVYPYEWSFSQLQDAALATLEIQRRALAHGMILRDASAYNIQFVDGRPCLIDTLSFDVYEAGEPWVAYRQFCQHFVAPLALMSRVDLGLGQLLRVHIDGVPLALADRLLPVRHKLNLGTLTHLSLHARFQRQHQGTAQRAKATVSMVAMQGLLDSLERTVKSFRLPRTQTQWGDYYDHTNYSDAALVEKGRIVGELLDEVKPQRVMDLGANDGSFSRIAAGEGRLVISCDIDPLAVESNYRQMRGKHETGLVPMLVDLTNPSPGLGWAGAERKSFESRAQVDAALALALIHHLAIAANVPLPLVAEYFARLTRWLVIEFVPKSDSQVQRLLATREDIFDDYTVEGFEAAFAQYFELTAKRPVAGTKRLVYLMKTKRG